MGHHYTTFQQQIERLLVKRSPTSDTMLTECQLPMSDSPGQPRDATRVHTVVALIPRGRVATYGQVAELAGFPRRARWVGFLMSQLPQGSSLPWYRVVNSQGVITCPAQTRATEQLISEGVTVANGRVNMTQFQWRPKA